jgi:hypothetical protein
MHAQCLNIWRSNTFNDLLKVGRSVQKKLCIYSNRSCSVLTFCVKRCVALTRGMVRVLVVDVLSTVSHVIFGTGFLVLLSLKGMQYYPDRE